MGETPAQRRRRMKKERRDAAKSTRREHRKWMRLRRRFVRFGRPTILILLVAVVIAGLWFVTGRERREARGRLGDLVVAERSLGRDHTPSTTTEPAPTSGAHSGPAVCGIQFEPLDADTQIHSLEHGSVLFQYREDDVSQEEVEALGELTNEFGSHVTVAPNPRLTEPFVATAWTKKMELTAVDIDLARDFAIAFREQGPERVDCDV